VTPDDAAAIADLAVTYGLPLFIEQGLKRCGWRADGGASLRSYFINACLLKFSNASRAWVPDSCGRQFTDYDVVDQIPSQRTHDRPDEIAVLRAVIAGLLRDESPEIRAILELHVDGFTYQEIADQLGNGMTAKAVERKMNRAKIRIARRDQGKKG
jgi:RNA polymerase sigma-70 factor (ECF subfamily)